MAHLHKQQCTLFIWMTLLALIQASQKDVRCNEIDQLTDHFNSQPEHYSCSSFTACNGMKCDVDLFGLAFDIVEETYSVSLWVLPCTSPPSLKIALKHPNPEVEPFDQVLLESVYVEFGESPLNVTIDHVEGVEQIRVKIEFDNPVLYAEEEGTLLPWTTFNVNTTQCDISTCQAIEQAVDTATSFNFTFGDSLLCRLTPRCDGFTCQVSPFNINARITVSAKIVACNDPPAIQIAIDNPLGGADLLNGLFTESATVPLASELNIDGINIVVTVDQFEEGLGVGVTVSVQLTDQQPPTLETILNYQYFPISRDYEYCNAFNPTCLALEGVVDKADRNDILCNTTEQCDGVLCWFDLLQNGALFPATASLVPCNKPMPAVDIKILDPSNSSKVVFGRRVSDSEKISFFGFEIDILVEHLPEDSLGFEITVVDTNSEHQTEPIQAIRYSIIPVNTSLCTTDSGVNQMQPVSVVSVIMATIAVIVGCFF